MKDKKIYYLEGMHCASCAAKIEKAVSQLKGVAGATVNFAMKKLYVDGEAKDDEVINAVSKIGDYKASLVTPRISSAKEISGNTTTTFIVQ